MSMPAVVRITDGSGPAVVRVLPAGFSVTLPQALGTTASPTFVGLTLSGRSGDSGKLAVFGAGGVFGALTVGSGLSIVNGVLTATASGAGTVTSVGLSVPTGLSIANSPITTNGTLAITLTAGYGIPTTASQATWDTAYSERNQWDGSSAGLNAATGRASLGLGSAAQSATTDFATAEQGTNSREWSASTASQAEAEAGSSTTRLAFTPQRVFQAIAAWWAASAFKTKLDGIANGATANATNEQLRDRATHTGTQAFSTITSTPTTLSGYGITDALPSTYTIVNVSYSATINIDFTADTGKLLVIGTLTGNLTFTFSNIVQGKMVTVDILCDATQRNLTFPPNAKFIGFKPGQSSIAASKAAAISFTVTRLPSSSTDDSAVRVAYGVQG